MSRTISDFIPLFTPSKPSPSSYQRFNSSNLIFSFNFIGILFLISLNLLLVAVSGTSQSNVEWSYSTLEDVCQASTNSYPYQSPINIMSPFVYQDPNIKFEYQINFGPASLMNNNGNTLQMTGDFGQFIYQDKQVFSASQIIFHSPSEHTFTYEFKHYPLEMQIYHEDQDKNKAMVSVFFEVGNEDSEFLARLGFDPDKSPKVSDLLADLDSNAELYLDNTVVDLKTLIGDPDEYLMYEGTLTQPNCDYGVTWVVLSQTKTLSQRQLNKFPQRLLNNYRQIQARNNREIRISFKETQEKPVTPEPQPEDQRQLFWSSNIEMPSFSLNGLVIDHPPGYVPAQRKPQSSSDEISKLAKIQIQKQYGNPTTVDEKAATSVPDKLFEIKTDKEVEEVEQPKKEEKGLAALTNQVQEQVKEESQSSHDSEADELFDSFMNNFFDTKKQAYNLAQTKLSHSNKPYSFAQKASTMLITGEPDVEQSNDPQDNQEVTTENLTTLNVDTEIDKVIEILDKIKGGDDIDHQQELLLNKVQEYQQYQELNNDDRFKEIITTIKKLVESLTVTIDIQQIDNAIMKLRLLKTTVDEDTFNQTIDFLDSLIQSDFQKNTELVLDFLETLNQNNKALLSDYESTITKFSSLIKTELNIALQQPDTLTDSFQKVLRFTNKLQAQAKVNHDVKVISAFLDRLGSTDDLMTLIRKVQEDKDQWANQKVTKVLRLLDTLIAQYQEDIEEVKKFEEDADSTGEQKEDKSKELLEEVIKRQESEESDTILNSEKVLKFLDSLISIQNYESADKPEQNTQTPQEALEKIKTLLDNILLQTKAVTEDVFLQEMLEDIRTLKDQLITPTTDTPTQKYSSRFKNVQTFLSTIISQDQKDAFKNQDEVSVKDVLDYIRYDILKQDKPDKDELTLKVDAMENNVEKVNEFLNHVIESSKVEQKEPKTVDDKLVQNVLAFVNRQAEINTIEEKLVNKITKFIEKVKDDKTINQEALQRVLDFLDIVQQSDTLDVDKLQQVLDFLGRLSQNRVKEETVEKVIQFVIRLNLVDTDKFNKVERFLEKQIVLNDQQQVEVDKVLAFLESIRYQKVLDFLERIYEKQTLEDLPIQKVNQFIEHLILFKKSGEEQGEVQTFVVDLVLNFLSKFMKGEAERILNIKGGHELINQITKENESEEYIKNRPTQLLFQPTYINTTLAQGRALEYETGQPDQIAAQSLDQVKQDFMLGYHLDSQQKSFSSWIRGQDYRNIVANRNHEIRDITFDEISTKALASYNTVKVLEKMGNLGATFIAKRPTNAFEIKFNDVDVNKSVTHTVREMDYQIDKLRSKNIEESEDLSLARLSKIFNLQRKAEHQEVQETVRGDMLDRNIEDKIKIGTDKKHAFVDKYVDKLDGQKFVDEHYLNNKQFNNQDLVKSAIKEGKFIVAGIKENIEQQTDQTVDKFVDNIDTITLYHQHNLNLEANNDNFIKEEEHKYIPLLRAEKDQRQMESNKPMVKAIDELILDYKRKSQEAVENQVINDLNYGQLDQLQVGHFLANHHSYELKGQFKPTINIKPDYEQVYTEGNKYDMLTENTKTFESTFQKDLSNRIEKQIELDALFTNEWDEETVPTRDDLIDSILDDIRPDVKLKTVADDWGHVTPIHEAESSITSQQKEEDAITFVDQKQKLLTDDICQTGQRQSPINIKAPFQVESQEEIVSFYFNEFSDREPKLKRDLSTGMIFVQGSWGSVSFEGEEYKMYGMYIHHPSEHTFGQESLRSDMEIQLLHYSSSTSKIVMISLLFDINPQLSLDNEFLKKLNMGPFFNDANLFEQDYPSDRLSLRDLVGGDLEELIKLSYYVRYDGGVTYVPCTENVTWIVVLNKFNNLSLVQLGDLSLLSGKDTNIRDVQPLNDRTLYIS